MRQRHWELAGQLSNLPKALTELLARVGFYGHWSPMPSHLAKTPAGLALRIAQRLLALTLGIRLNTLSGRPARALAAFDGR